MDKLQFLALYALLLILYVLYIRSIDITLTGCRNHTNITMVVLYVNERIQLYIARDIFEFVMYYVHEVPRSSLLRECIQLCNAHVNINLHIIAYLKWQMHSQVSTNGSCPWPCCYNKFLGLIGTTASVNSNYLTRYNFCDFEVVLNTASML